MLFWVDLKKITSPNHTLGCPNFFFFKKTGLFSGQSGLFLWKNRPIFGENRLIFRKKNRLFFQKVAFRSTLTPRWRPATFNLKNSGNHYWDPGSIFRDAQGQSLGPWDAPGAGPGTLLGYSERILP